MEPRDQHTRSAGTRWARRAELAAWFLLPIPIMILTFGAWIAVAYAGYGTVEMALVVGFGLLASLWAGGKWARRMRNAGLCPNSMDVVGLTTVPVACSIALVVVVLACTRA